MNRNAIENPYQLMVWMNEVSLYETIIANKGVIFNRKSPLAYKVNPNWLHREMARIASGLGKFSMWFDVAHPDYVLDKRCDDLCRYHLTHKVFKIR